MPLNNTNIIRARPQYFEVITYVQEKGEGYVVIFFKGFGDLKITRKSRGPPGHQKNGS